MSGIILLFLTNAYFTPFFSRANVLGKGSQVSFAEVDYSQAPFLLWLTRMAYLLVGSAGLAGWVFNIRKVGAYPRWAMLFLFAWSVALVFVHDFNAEWFQTNALIYGKLAPGTMVVMGVVCWGADERAWPTLKKWIIRFAWVATWIFFFGLLKMDGANRSEAYRWVFEPSLFLGATAMLVAAGGMNSRGWRFFGGMVPLLAFLISAVVLMDRLQIVIFAVMLYSFLIFRDWMKSRNVEWVALKLAVYSVVFPALAAAAFGAFVFFDQGIIGSSAKMLGARVLEDTRSQQFRRFFHDLSPGTVAIGNGHIFQSGSFGGGTAAGIDCGYLNLLWIGGLPLLVPFLYLMASGVMNGFKARRTEDAAVISLLAAVAVEYFSSASPSFSAVTVIAFLFLGRALRLGLGANGAGRP
ncbi:MAG TPA: hypothetical protein VK914_01930 [bacterium]|nr:hypothetical protein [bacterium]